MPKLAKKIIVVCLLFVFVICQSVTCFALFKTGGAEIYATSIGGIYRNGDWSAELSGTKKVNNEVYNVTDNRQEIWCEFHFSSESGFSGDLETAAFLNFSSSNNVGKLSFDIEVPFANNLWGYVLKNGDTNEIITSGSVNGNYVNFEYSGVIPSSLLIVGYQSYYSTTYYWDLYAYNFVFTPTSILEQEKDIAENTGQESIDDVTGVIEDKSEGFISALGQLVSAMSYDGTMCAWTFPALKLPAIEGVMPEYVLSEEKPIDFEIWVEKIPANILLLVRSLCTIALIVFCFKELYSTISYVLTLKGGSGNE